MRMTDPTKWDDEWFLDLHPIEKLVWMYMCERCDIAGFYAIPKRKASFEIGITVDEYLGAYKGLNRGYLDAKDGSNVWIRNFTKYQRNLPLNKWNNAHKSIIERMLNNLDNYRDNKSYISIPLEFRESRDDKLSKIISVKLGAYEGLMSPPSKGKGKGKGNSLGIDKDLYTNWDAKRFWCEITKSNDNKVKKDKKGYSQPYLEWFYLDLIAPTKKGNLKFQERESLSVGGLLSNYATQGYYKGGSPYAE
jgi:hypothetical protein